MTSPQQRASAATLPFERTLADGGTDPAVAAELERRIRIVEHDERDDASRLPMSARELVGYVGVSIAAVALGIVVVIL
ncbi:hypothetical protein [Agrococcus lahaulensis]|uniref:hypothetical protein n=1 Tax=Agrococcus lahaulensis TaxID=341722 RepID=UPI00047CEE97|nr:hypothetical protein [Agrococcus lahaulensis]